MQPMYENTLTNWSWKKYKMYQTCPYSVYLKYIKRVPGPPQDPKYDEKRKRGIRLHDELAETINNGAPVPAEAKDFSDIIEAYIDLDAVAEGDEFFDRQWNLMPPEYSRLPYYEQKEHWLVVKKDIRIRVPNEYVLVADWKTGKKYGNEVDHFLQMKLYAATEFVIDPGFPEYAVELQYLDQKDTWAHSFKPSELEQHLGVLERDIDIMFNDTTFRPKPSIFACRYCDYNLRNGTNACPHAVK